MPTKLHQILAVEKGVRTRADDTLTQADRTLGKDVLLKGITRDYKPKDDDGEVLPAESTLVQVRVNETLKEAATRLARLWDVVAIKEWSNTTAKADIVLDDGTVLAKDVPVTYMLFLGHQLDNVHTLVSRLPTLDPQYEWDYDEGTRCYRTKPQMTQRTKKIPKVLVRAQATKEHPEQTEVFHEDQIIGFWNTTILSGAITMQARQDMIDRVEELQRAVKKAREAANDVEVTEVPVAEKLLGYVLPEVSLRGEGTAVATA